MLTFHGTLVRMVGKLALRSGLARIAWTNGVSIALVLGAASACTEEKAPGVPLTSGGGSSICASGESLVCDQGSAVQCADGGVENSEDCADAGLSCDPAYGCIACRPSAYLCRDNTVYRCAADGRSESLVEECAGGTQCSPGGCVDLCGEAESSRSYLGCDYWPTFTSNSQLDPVFLPAVVVANPNLVPATITISKGDRVVETVLVDPQSAETVMLEFDDELKGAFAPGDGSVLVESGAYHLVSSVPVTVHQFNPLLFETDQDCDDPKRDRNTVDGRCNSFTNDASLLLPSHVLERARGEGVSYLGISRPTFVTEFVSEGTRRGFPGFLAITGVGEGPVNVRVKSRAHTLASSDGKVPDLSPGEELTMELGPGDVLELRSATPDDCPGESAILYEGMANELVVCDPGEDYDLTGTEIEADGPVQVIGGHDCTYVPFDRPACDHLEESIFPLETWGDRVLVTRPRASSDTRYRLRVVSGADDNRITFAPEVHEDVTLDRGEFVEVSTDQHVEVRGQKLLAVAQFLEGQGGSADSGDPSMTLAIPIEQFREEYYFISPDTYLADYVNVIAPEGAEVLLDGESIEGWQSIDDGDYVVVPLPLERAGEHEIRGKDGHSIGIVLYGYGDYTSYMLPGGLDLRIIGITL